VYFMQEAFLAAIFATGLALSIASCGYMVLALIGVSAFRKESMRRPAGPTPPVTILKPLCGLDYGLYENLKSFCDQDYPDYQIVFGVRDPKDPAIPVVERLIKEHPGRDIALVVDPRIFGANLKVSNLINMCEAAKHEVIVIADSDMRATPDYLAAVVGPFAEPRVGAVTCLYKGTSSSELLSSFASMFINNWFLPSVLVARRLQGMHFALGATIAVRREIVERSSGFRQFADHLADDYMIGQFVRDCGYSVKLSDYVIENVVHEPAVRALVLHELRWARTIRTLRPGGYRFAFLANTISVATMAWAMNAFTLNVVSLEGTVLVVAVALRLMLHFAVCDLLKLRDHGLFWMIPFRDLLSFAIWLASYFGKSVEWRDSRFGIQPDGCLAPSGKMSTP
jgi:ceramide glucosyltransferase